MKLWTWFKSLWHKDAVEKSIAAAKALAEGLSNAQFEVIVGEVESIRNAKDAAGEAISGIEKAARVEAILSDPKIRDAYKFPEWVKDGFSVLSTIIKLAWTVAKLTKRI